MQVAHAQNIQAAAAPTAPKPAAVRWWLMAPILVTFVIVNQLDKTNVSVLIATPRFVSDLGATGQHARLGFLATAFFIGYGLSLMAWGFAVDRIGPRRSALLGVTGWAVTTAWCGLAGDLTTIYLARFALGLTEGCMWPVCNTYASRWFPVHEHGRIQAFWVNGAQIGIAIGLPMVTAILLAAGWRAVFFVCAAGSVCLLAPAFYWLAPDYPGGQVSNWYRPAAKLKLTFLRSHRFWMVSLCHACLVATFFGLTTWIPTYLTKARGLPFTTMSAWVACAYLIPVGLALLAGYAADLSMRRARVGAFASVAMAAMIVAAVLVPNTVVSMLLLVVSMAAPITYGAMNSSLMHRLAPPEQIGRATGIFVGVANVLGAAGPTVVGWLIGIFGGHYLAAFGFIGAVNLIQAALYVLIGRVEED
jgi:MFS family permease